MTTAQELYDICAELAAAQPDDDACRRLHEVMALCAATGCQGENGVFGNLFAQIDFLCHKLGLSHAQKQAIQTARRHSNQSKETAALTKDDTADWLYDLRAVAIFISAVFQEDVPHRLLTMLPRNLKPRTKGLAVNKDYIRCIVRSFDDTTITASTDDDEIIVDYGNTDQGRDYAYLRKILHEGMQLNLLECHVADVVTPGLIVVEPDYLIDISSLAACFTEYGHHPLLYTLSRLKPRANTQAIQLGHFAGAALDDIINNDEARLTHTLQRTFREHALRFCTCADFDADVFKADAARQMQNIRQTVQQLFGKDAPFDRDKALLEPAFICERLGLQGRVDLMTSDMKLLVEQKSGKNMKIERQSFDHRGVQREDHYVQLLLYYGILRYNFDKSDKQVDTRLLYSRYEPQQGLVAVNYYRTLFREAVKVRNQVVATDLYIAREGFGQIMPLLHPDVIYRDVRQDSFFQRYILPETARLQALYQSLNPLEKHYYERMMTFVYREQVCQKVGNSISQLHGSGSTADLWQMPLNEKMDTGTIYTDLTVADRQRSSEYGGYDIITLSVKQQPDDEHQMCTAKNFRRGDMVILYRYDDTPDVRSSILYKGTLQDMQPHQLVVRINDGQQNPDIFPIAAQRQRWAVEHASSDASTIGCMKSLHQFIQCPPERKELLLGCRTPQADTSLQLSHPYNPHYDDILLKVKQTRDYFLLVGPPGTGKTSMALRFMVEEEMKKDCNVLLTAYTNRAVDEICAMLTETAVPFIRLGNAASCDPRYTGRLLEAMLEQTPRLQDIRQLITTTPVIVSTTSTLLSRPFIFQLKRFSLTIVDEASQILEPGLIGLLAMPETGRFVLVGDHKQLPAVVQQDASQTQVDEPDLKAIGLNDCRQSLFERLYRWEQTQGRTQFIGTLSHQGRMHPEVADFASRHFYQSHLLPVPRPHQLETRLDYDLPAEDRLDHLLKNHRILFLPVVPAQQPASTKSNADEARLVADLLRRIVRFHGSRFDATKTVGVIVPYRNQIAAIRHEMMQMDLPQASDILIDTVERFQGSQRDVIIYSFTVSRRYQLDFLAFNTFEENGQDIDRKLNVALTRARHQMIMTGNPDILKYNSLFASLMARYAMTETPWHPMDDDGPRPRLMNDPFDYEPHPLCLAAMQQVRDYLHTQTDWQAEVESGKMFGVLVCEDAQGRLGFLAAYSGQIQGRADWPWFVPAVFDYLQPMGYFKQEEGEISAINRQVGDLENDPELTALKARLQQTAAQAEAEIDAYKAMMREAKAMRHRQRTSDNEADNEALVRESQHQKAELRRLKKRWETAIDQLKAQLKPMENEIERLKQCRKQRSDALQRWLFDQFVMQNDHGERRTLTDIFRDTPQHTPPSGAGECCAPKLLQYAFQNHLKPLSIAECWQGQSPRMEIRRHDHFYPACRGKCLPILSWMLSEETYQPRRHTPRHTDLQIVHEDDALLVVNKPSGLLSVPGRTGEPSVESILRESHPHIYMVHRLDMDTSGLMVVALTPDAYHHLQRQFADRTVHKQYAATLEGLIDGPKEGRISLPLRPDPLDRPRQVVDREHGKEAITDYVVTAEENGHTRILLTPRTGRTHQLRVHCAHPDGLNCPILGDPLYGHAADRLHLHAWHLAFVHPKTGEEMSFQTNQHTHMNRIIECVPNFSEGQDKQVIQKIADQIAAVPGVMLLNVDPGEAANRTVYTFAGTPEGVTEAAFLAAKTAGDLIDMRRQHGTHPRIGATDVLPLVPISGVTLQECADMARRLARRMADEAGIPCYLYEASALQEKRRNLAFCRRGEYEAIMQKLTTPERMPDVLPEAVRRGDYDRALQTGCSVVGARDFLIAVNFNLDTTSVEVATEIARDVREKGRSPQQPGTLKCTKAIGWYIDEYGIAQVSMNMTNFHVTPLHQAFEEVSRCAAVRGVHVTGTEIIGMVPREVLVSAGIHFLQQQGKSADIPERDIVDAAVKAMRLDDLRPFNPDEKVIEYRMKP